MSTNLPPQPGDNLQKSAEDVVKSLGVFYKEAHAVDPSGQAGQAIQQIMQAVAEVAHNAGQGGGSQDPFMQAAQNVQSQMQAQPAPGPDPSQQPMDPNAGGPAGPPPPGY
jgi:DNA/RNA-binding domain of Phe-tRNA-synthetase-like protein